jgi:hypothetical protein
MQRLRKLGWIEGQTIAIIYLWAQGRIDRGDRIDQALIPQIREKLKFGY